MKKLFALSAFAVLFGTGVVGCSNTANGAAEDTAKNTAAVEKAADTAATKTVEGAQKAGAAVEKGAVTAGAAVEKGAAETGAAVQKGAAEAGAAVEKGAAETGAAVQKGAAEAAKAADNAGQVVKHTGKVLTVTPTVKAALLKDEKLYPTSNPSENSINVDTGSDGETVVLSGHVKSEELKKYAEKLAKSASPGSSYKVDNKLTVGQ